MLHSLCSRLLARAAAPHVDVPEIEVLAREIHASFVVHLSEEEAGLAPDRLRELITPEGLAALSLEAEAARARWTE